LNPYILALIILAAIGIIGFGIYYYLRIYKKTVSMEHDYLWLGPGEHPFKGRK